MFCLARKSHVLSITRQLKDCHGIRCRWTNNSQVSRRLEARDLWKPAAFSFGFSGLAFGTAAVWKYENQRQKAKELWPNPWAAPRKTPTGSFLTEGQKVALSIAAVNLLVFGGWRMKQWTPFMLRYFVSSPITKPVCLPMLLSSFSHTSLMHLGVNMFVLFSFSDSTVHVFGKEQFCALYLSSGVFASLGSLCFKILTGVTQASVGASGAILGIIATHCLLFPSSQIQIIFLPFFAFSAASALKGVMALDFLGMLFRWSFFDHAGHFAGALFGIFYLKFGQQLYFEYGSKLIKQWQRISGK